VDPRMPLVPRCLAQPSQTRHAAQTLSPVACSPSPRKPSLGHSVHCASREDVPTCMVVGSPITLPHEAPSPLPRLDVTLPSSTQANPSDELVDCWLNVYIEALPSPSLACWLQWTWRSGAQHPPSLWSCGPAGTGGPASQVPRQRGDSNQGGLSGFELGSEFDSGRDGVRWGQASGLCPDVACWQPLRLVEEEESAMP
jgi:hypothetical protein